MKKIILSLILIIVASTYSYSQFNPESGIKTNKTLVIQSKTYNTFKTNKGSEYIICTSPRTNKKYAVWIGTPTNKTFKGLPVRLTKKGKPFILIISKNTNNPYPKYIKEKI